MRKLLNRKLITLTLLLCILGSLVYFEITHFAPQRLDTVRVSLKSASIPKDFNGVKIAVFSDVHGDLEKLRMAQKAMDTESPDFIIFLGNLIGDLKSEEDLKELSDILTTMRPPLGKYAIMGSYDTQHYQEVLKLLDSSGFRLIQNRTQAVHNYTDQSIQFLFLDETNTEQNYGSVLDSYDDSIPTIAFMNNPNIIDGFKTKRALAAIGGETLGGKINLPLLGSVVYRNQYTKSDVTIDGTRLLLSSGISSDGSKTRLLANPNILVLTLESSD